MTAPCGIQIGRKGFGGLIDRMLADHIERLVLISGAGRYKKFVKAAQDTAGTQPQVLRQILRYAEDTVFGREHGFKQISTYEDFKQRVDATDYEAHRPYIERHQRGETDVLFPGKPLMYNCSSGTSGKPKLLPVTPYNFETTFSGLYRYDMNDVVDAAHHGSGRKAAAPLFERQNEIEIDLIGLSHIAFATGPGERNPFE